MEDTKKTKAVKKSANPLVAAAKALGSVAGTVASTLGVHEEAAPAAEAAPAPARKAAAPSIGKLPKKNKSRLPRKEKKALKRKGLLAK